MEEVEYISGWKAADGQIYETMEKAKQVSDSMRLKQEYYNTALRLVDAIAELYDNRINMGSNTSYLLSKVLEPNKSLNKLLAIGELINELSDIRKKQEALGEK